MSDHNRDVLNYTVGLLMGVAVNLKDKNLADVLQGASEAIQSVLESEERK